VTFALADALSWLVASRAQIHDVLELEARGPDDPVASEGLEGTVQFLSDLCTRKPRRPPARSPASAPNWSSVITRTRLDEEEHRNCFLASELDEFEETMPGISAIALDVLTADGAHPQKAVPAPLARETMTSCACKQADRLPERLAPGQGPRRRYCGQGDDPEALDYPA